MLIKAIDNKGYTHTGPNMKSFLITEDNGNPLVIVKETKAGSLTNYKILTPGEKEFDDLARALGYVIEVQPINRST